MPQHLKLLIVLALGLLVAHSWADVVEIKGLGAVQGHKKGDQFEYLGIPYAEPPVGPLRFKAPQPVKPWSNTIVADRRVACIQSARSIDQQSEDCLVVNIWRPVNSSESIEKLPVLVYIHTGAWRRGSGIDSYINATNYNKEGVIVVSFNHRLDILGHLAHAALTAEEPRNPTNFGLLDQRMALHWVSQHIAAFNGDPNRVTAMGVSAGAQSIVVHMQSWREYKPKFQRAIIMSAYPLCTTVYLNQAEEFGQQMVKELGCNLHRHEDIMSCLRSLPAEELVMARTARLQMFGNHWRDGMYLINDGVNFKSSYRVFLNGQYDLNIPVIIGTTADEGSFFSKMAFPVQSISNELYTTLLLSSTRHYVRSASPLMLHTLLNEYSTLNAEIKQQSEPAFWAYSKLVGDSYFTCPTLRVTEGLSKRQPIYGYLFNTTGFMNGLKAHHGADLPYAMGPDAFLPLTASQRNIAENMLQYFTKFIKTGSPSGPGLPLWPNYAPDHALMSFEPELRVIYDYKRDTCQFWEQNFPEGFVYTGEDYFNDESNWSALLNKYPFMVLSYLWRKRRFAKPAIGALAVVTVWITYKLARCCCCKSRFGAKNNSKKSATAKTTDSKKKK